MFIFGLFLLSFLMFYLAGGLQFLSTKFTISEAEFVRSEGDIDSARKLVLVGISVLTLLSVFVLGMFIYPVVVIFDLGYLWFSIYILTLAFYDFILVGTLKIKGIKYGGLVTNVSYLVYIVIVLIEYFPGF